MALSASFPPVTGELPSDIAALAFKKVLGSHVQGAEEDELAEDLRSLATPLRTYLDRWRSLVEDHSLRIVHSDGIRSRDLVSNPVRLRPRAVAGPGAPPSPGLFLAVGREVVADLHPLLSFDQEEQALYSFVHSAAGKIGILRNTGDAPGEVIECEAVIPWLEALTRDGLPDNDLIGLDKQIKCLRATLQSWTKSRVSKPVFVIGEIGTGKSNLIGKVLAQHELRVVRVSGVDYSKGEFRITLEILSRLFEVNRNHDGLVLETLEEFCRKKNLLGPRQLADFLRSDTTQKAARPTGGAPDEDRTQARELNFNPFDELWRVVSVQAEDRPLILWLEEAHELVHTDLLPALISASEQGAEDVLLIIELRAEAEYRHASLRARYGKRGGEIVTCKNLSRANSETLAARRIGVSKRDIPRYVRDRIFEASGGNPKFITDFVQYLKEQGFIVTGRSGVEINVPRDLRPPEQLADIALARLRYLDLGEIEEQILVLLSLAPHAYVPVRVLAGVLGTEVEAAVNGLIDAQGILQMSEDLEDPVWRVRLEHETLRNACRRLLAEKGSEFRARLHTRVAAGYRKARVSADGELSTLRAVIGTLAEELGLPNDCAPHLISRLLAAGADDVAELRRLQQFLRRTLEPTTLTQTLLGFSQARLLDLEGNARQDVLAGRYLELAKAEITPDWDDEFLLRAIVRLSVRCLSRAVDLDKEVMSKATHMLFALQARLVNSTPNSASSIRVSQFAARCYCNPLGALGGDLYRTIRSCGAAASVPGRSAAVQVATLGVARLALVAKAPLVCQSGELDADFELLLSAIADAPDIPSKKLLANIGSEMLTDAQWTLLADASSVLEDLKKVREFSLRLAHTLAAEEEAQLEVEARWLRDRLADHARGLIRRQEFEEVEESLEPLRQGSTIDSVIADAVSAILRARRGEERPEVDLVARVSALEDLSGISHADLSVIVRAMVSCREPQEGLSRTFETLVVQNVAKGRLGLGRALDLLEEIPPWYDLRPTLKALESGGGVLTAWDRLQLKIAATVMRWHAVDSPTASLKLFRDVDHLIDEADRDLRGGQYNSVFSRLVHLACQIALDLPVAGPFVQAKEDSLKLIRQLQDSGPTERIPLNVWRSKWHLQAQLGQTEPALQEALSKKQAASREERGFFTDCCIELMTPSEFIPGANPSSENKVPVALSLAFGLFDCAFDSYDLSRAACAIGALSLYLGEEDQEIASRKLESAATQLASARHFGERFGVLKQLGVVQFARGRYAEAREVFVEQLDYVRRGVVIAGRSTATSLRNSIAFIDLSRASSPEALRDVEASFQAILTDCASDSAGPVGRYDTCVTEYNLAYTRLVLGDDDRAFNGFREIARKAPKQSNFARAVFLRVYLNKSNSLSVRHVREATASYLSMYWRLVETKRPEEAFRVGQELWQGLPREGAISTDVLLAILDVAEREPRLAPPIGLLERLLSFHPNLARRIGLLLERKPIRPAKQERNARCECGSGLKFKKCCGRPG